ncbi:4-(cytidine 5'-diphospho)-2-C-methyl-D-erythritol kinase [Aliikangiella sp. IMCC44359]|uniref:4-(cytidine 5'-diphospho)-2-C-methyl-D-erythritol kinase n=1 Tax=Aliikangiella sp. IMCC44359 TaxID=3459125 RepID=UPI00403A85A0
MNNQTIQWPSPAKLNLFLHIISQREDGYHNLQSVFQLLDYGDSLEVAVKQNDQIQFTCDKPELSNNDNLVVTAAIKLKQFAETQLNHTQLGAKIHLQKKLPAGGGLGGGSSNCATTLIALNHQWQLGLSLQQLADIGLSLGADVPIFVMGNTAFVEGIGEVLTPISLPETWYLVIQPPCHISTAKIFSNSLLTRNSKAIKIRDLNALELPYQGLNTMQTIACEQHPEVKQAIDWLKQFNQSARMTGSGSCVFAAFDNEQEMRKIATRCEWSHFVAKGVNQSPVHIRKLA